MLIESDGSGSEPSDDTHGSSEANHQNSHETSLGFVGGSFTPGYFNFGGLMSRFKRILVYLDFYFDKEICYLAELGYGRFGWPGVVPRVGFGFGSFPFLG